MYRIGPLDNSRKIYFDFTGLENDKEFKDFCNYFDKFDPKVMIIKLEQLNQTKQNGYKSFHLSNFDDVKQYIERLLHIGHYYNEKKKLVFKLQQYDNEIKQIKSNVEQNVIILESRGLKNHNLHNMLPEAKLKHIRSCDECNKVADFKKLTNDEILHNKVSTYNDKINKLETEIKKLDFDIIELDEKIKDIKNRVYPFTKHLMNTYLKHKIFIQDSDKQNEKITFCVDIGDVIVEVPFTEIIAIAMEGYAKEKFKKKL